MKPTLLLLLLALLLSSCSPGSGGATPTATTTPTITPTATATAQPMAVVVNGEGITVAEFEAEVQRYLAAQQALGIENDKDRAAQFVLDDLIAQLLLAQGAAAAGYTVDDATLQERIDTLIAQIGGEQVLLDWQTAHGYTDEGFRITLRRQMAVAWMRDTIANAVPAVAEQVHAKQILLYNADSAQLVWDQLESGADFETLAAQYDPLTKGELGWFPQGYLLDAGIDEAVFALPPGQYSEILQSDAGYHIILVMEREADHPLSPDARLSLQWLALEDWLEQQQAQSTIVVTP